MTSRSEETKGSIPFGEPVDNDPFSQLQQPSSKESPSKNVADASVLFNDNNDSADFFSNQPSNASATNFFNQQQAVTPESFFDHLGRTSSAKSQEYVSQQPTSLIQAYEPSYTYDQQAPEQNQWQQFDPNVHYYYDEQNVVHYYDPNTNQEYDMSQYGYDYQYDAQYYSQEGYNSNTYASVAGQDQGTQQATVNHYQPDALALAQQQYTSSAQEGYDPNLYAANPTDNHQTQEQQQYPSVQENYSPDLYSSDPAVVPVDNQPQQQQHNPIQKAFDANLYAANPVDIQQPQEMQQYAPIQDNYNSNMYTANPTDSKQSNYQHQEQHAAIQDGYDPNVYAANPMDNHRSDYQNQQPSQQQQQSYSLVQDNYNPNMYTANLESVPVDIQQQHQSDEQQHAAVQESFDSSFYDPNQVVNTLADNQQQPDYHQEQEQQQQQQQESSEPKTFAATPAIVSADNQQANYQQHYNADVYNSESYTTNAFDQQDAVFEDLQSSKDAQVDQSIVSQNPHFTASSLNENNDTTNAAVFDVSNDEPATTDDTMYASQDLNRKEVSQSKYNPELYSIDHKSKTNQEEKGTQLQQEQAEGNQVSPDDVVYFNYQDQTYSPNGFNTHPINPEQQELGTNTPTALVDLNGAPFVEPTIDQGLESQFAEVQLAPASSYISNDAITVPSTTETSQPDLVAYSSGTEQVKSEQNDYPNVEQLNAYESLTGDSQFEEVQFPQLYKPAETTARAISPNPLPNRVTSPFGSSPFSSTTKPPERILSPPSSLNYGRPSLDHASPRSSLDRSFTDRVASPALPLIPCPDPQCEGENKPKAKFCCECGRPLAGLSRSNTPFSRTATPFAMSEVVQQRNPLDDKKEAMIASLKNFVGHSVFFDTSITVEQKRAALVSYVEGRINEFSNEDSKCLLWKIVKLLIEEDGVLGESKQLDDSIVSLLGSVKESDGSGLLDQLEGFLLKGDREGACQFAMDHDMWDHALIISREGDLYKQVVSRFMDRALFSSSAQWIPQASEDKKYLRILYSLFSGTDMVTQLVRNTVEENSSVSKETLKDWKAALSLILTNRTNGDQAAIHSLGNGLKQCELVDESCICYILSPETSVLSGLDASITDASYTDLDLFYIAELYDFALKDGNTPSLQTFKFIHSWWLADLGFEQESQAYCESIISAIGSSDHSMFIERFKQISRLLLESPSENIASLLNKSTFDKLIDTIENKFKVDNYGGYSTSNNYYTNQTPFSYGQDASTYAAPEQSQGTASQGAYDYGYSYGESYTPAADTSYTPAADTSYTPAADTGYTPAADTSYQHVHTTTATSYSPVDTAYQSPGATNAYQNDDDDLGFGNSSTKKNKGISEQQPSDESEKKEAAPKEEPKKEQEKSSGWGLFSLFSRKETHSTDEKKPVKANLGQESSFYYDEEQKRWVNKLNDTKPVAATPPPPPKAMTPQPQPSAIMSPPPTSLGPNPSSVPPRVNSAPISSPLSSGAPPAASNTPPIGNNRRAGTSGRKPMRSRYVDVFNSQK